MTKMKTSLLAAAAIGALSLGYSTDANASAYALTTDTVSQLLFTAVGSGGEIGFDSFNFSATTTAFLNSGENDFGFDIGNAPFSLDRDAPVVNTVDPDAANAGTATNANNDFTANGQNNASYARGDHHLTDTRVNTNGFDETDGIDEDIEGGDFQTIVETFVVNNGGAGNASNSQTWSLDFEVPTGETAAITISFNLDLNQLTELAGDDSGNATSNFNLTFSVGGTTINFASLISADADDTSESADETAVAGSVESGAATIAISDAGGVRHFVVTFSVGEGDHSLLINYGAAASALSVVAAPEPATLGLLGAGLLGLGAIARRRKIAA